MASHRSRQDPCGDAGWRDGAVIPHIRAGAIHHADGLAEARPGGIRFGPESRRAGVPAHRPCAAQGVAGKTADGVWPRPKTRWPGKATTTVKPYTAVVGQRSHCVPIRCGLDVWWMSQPKPQRATTRKTTLAAPEAARPGAGAILPARQGVIADGESAGPVGGSRLSGAYRFSSEDRHSPPGRSRVSPAWTGGYGDRSQFLLAQPFSATLHDSFSLLVEGARNAGSELVQAISPSARSIRRLTATSDFEYRRICLERRVE